MEFSETIEIPVGGYSKEVFVRLMNVSGEGFGPFAKYMVNHELFTILPTKKILTIARCEPEDLGCNKNSTYFQLQEAVKGVGGLCPCEVGPRLRVKLPRKPEGHDMILVMDQLPNSDDQPSVFRVMQLPDTKLRDGGVIPGQKMLNSRVMYPYSVIGPSIKVAFVFGEVEST